MNYKMKELSLQNLEECTVLYTSVFNGDPWNDGWLHKDVKERLSEIIHNQHYWGIGLFSEYGFLNGFLMGYSEKWLQDRHFNLIEMCVNTELQSKGVGTRLINSLESYCKERKIKRITLLTARDGQAENFYKKNGFYVSQRMMMMSKIVD